MDGKRESIHKVADKEVDDELVPSRIPESTYEVAGKEVDDELFPSCIPEEEEHPIEQVRLTVPNTDDPTLPAFTFRVLVMGLTSCVLLSFTDQYFAFRKNPIHLSLVLVQMFAVPVGRLMAATLTTKTLTVPGTRWEFSMNPGPWSIKEHVLVCMLAGGRGGRSASDIVALMKAYFQRPINPWASLLLVLTTDMIGYSFAGMFWMILVDNPYMWWPFTVADVSFFWALNEKDERRKGQLTKIQFFTIIFISSLAYYIIPNYLFPSITALSFVCWIWKDSILAQHLGSGLQGLGLGAFSLDWSTATAFLGSPLALPVSTIINHMAGFIILLYIISPIAYWTDTFDAKKFPFFATNAFDDNGKPYNLSRVLKKTSFEFDEQAYESYSKIYLGILFIYSYGFSFASLTATLSYFALYHGRSLWDQIKRIHKNQGFHDVHSNMMRKYDSIPHWWFMAILLSTIVLAIVCCEGFGKQLQLPYWGVLFAVALASTFILPFGVIQATTGQGIGLGIISELILGYIYPGRPLASMVFKAYSTSTIGGALSFLNDFKLGYYMKIPPRSMFLAQVLGSLVSCSITFGVTWWLFSSIDNICHPELLPAGSPWTCPHNQIMYTVTTLWGIIGPSRVFYPAGFYSKIFIFFIIGAITPFPIWILIQMFPKKKWIRHINVPIILAGATGVPPRAPVNYWPWFVVGILFNYIIYNKYRGWWSRYNYILSAGLTAGVAVMALLTSVTLQNNGIYGVNWWGLEIGDHCPLASCPIASGIKVEGCPVFH